MTEMPKPPRMRLDLFANPEFSRGASRMTELLWIIVSGLLFSTWVPGSGWRRKLLTLFGADVGKGVVIKPHVCIKFPWRLTLGDHVWLGERVWIDNLAQVTVGAHSCISQGAYLCTGSHDWADPRFALITRPITIGTGCWIGARATLAPGAVVGDGAVLAMHALGTGHLPAGQIKRADGGTRPRPEASPE